MGKTELHAGNLLALLRARHPLPRWAFFAELRNGTGFRQSRTIDAMAFDTWPSGHGRRVAYEIKVSRSDYLKELADPDKRKWVEECCQETWFVMPAGLVKPTEIPESWGLLEASAKQLRSKKIAPTRGIGAGDISYDIMLAVLRESARQVDLARERTFDLEGEKITPDQLQAIVEKRASVAQQKLNETRESLKKQHLRLQDATKILTAPLTHLWRRAHDYYGIEGILLKGEAPPTELVDTMINRAASAQLEASLKEIRNAHASLTKLVESLNTQKTGGHS